MDFGGGEEGLHHSGVVLSCVLLFAVLGGIDCLLGWRWVSYAFVSCGCVFVNIYSLII